MCYTFIHVVFLGINIRNDLPGSNTMWNDIAGRRSPEASTKGRQELIKKGSNSSNFRFLFSFPSSKLRPFMPINPPNSYDSNTSYHIQFDEELTKIDK